MNRKKDNSDKIKEHNDHIHHSYKHKARAKKKRNQDTTNTI